MEESEPGFDHVVMPMFDILVMLKSVGWGGEMTYTMGCKKRLKS